MPIDVTKIIHATMSLSDIMQIDA